MEYYLAIKMNGVHSTDNSEAFQCSKFSFFFCVGECKAINFFKMKIIKA